MKLPLMLSSYLCGECGIEMLLDRRRPEDRVKGGEFGPFVIATCHTPQCPQQGVKYNVVLQCAPVPTKPAEGSVDA